MAEYAIANKLTKEPVFAWWVPHTLRTRNRIISSLKSNRKIRKTTKFGITVLTSLEEAKQLDAKNGNNLWETAIKKELEKVTVAFELLEDDEKPAVWSKLINYHFVFMQTWT